MIFASATLAAAGTRQALATSLPQLGTITMGGRTSVLGGQTKRVTQLTVQADPANTGANIYLGGPQMVKATRANVGMVLAKGAAPVPFGDGTGFALDDIYFDGDTTGDKLLVAMAG